MKNLEFKNFEKPNQKYKPNPNNWPELNSNGHFRSRSVHFRSHDGHFSPASTGTLDCATINLTMTDAKSAVDALELELSMIRKTMDRLQMSGNILLAKLEKDFGCDEIPFSSPKIQGAWAWQTPRRDSKIFSDREISVLEPRRGANGNENFRLRKFRSSQLRNHNSNVIRPQRQSLKHSSDEEENETSRKFRIFERNLKNFKRITDQLYQRRLS